jgi:N,N'-diacetyllegionaminate synthase
MTRTIIIAEAGVNHNGDIDIAKKLVEFAADSGADIIKFQTFLTENIVSREAKKANYQQSNMADDKDNNQFSMLKILELSKEDHIVLIDHCRKHNIEFWSTAFDNDSIKLLQQLGINKWKIPSGEITNLPFLELIGSFGQEVILSTGMSNIDEIGDAISILVDHGTLLQNITVLHCNTEYPTPMKDVNLKAMDVIKNQFNVKIGYSDHTNGIEVPIAAVALGAEVIEKHFTLDRAMAGPDHKASLNPEELKAMISAIRNIEIALGNPVKEASESEIKNLNIVRKSIHLKRAMKTGDIIKSDDLAIIRPGDGISPMKINEVIGKKLLKDLDLNYKICWSDLS